MKDPTEKNHIELFEKTPVILSLELRERIRLIAKFLIDISLNLIGLFNSYTKRLFNPDVIAFLEL